MLLSAFKRKWSWRVAVPAVGLLFRLLKHVYMTL
jgi:hypothetical protein